MKLFKINEMCYCVAVDESLTCVFGSPPEWIKRAGGFPFPSYIFLGDTMLFDGSNFCEVEFPIYRNFFFNKQRKTHIIAPRRINEILKPILEEAIFGPADYEKNVHSEKAAYYADYLALREGFSPSGRKLHLPDFASFETYDNDVYKLGFITIRKTGSDSFMISKGKEELAFDLQGITSAFSGKKKDRKGDNILVLHCFGSGDGFSPAKECSSFMIEYRGKLLLFDPNYRSFDAFMEEGFDIADLAGIFVSHIHADHEQGLYRFLHAFPALPVYAVGEAAKSLEKKIRLLLGPDVIAIRKLPPGISTVLDEIGAEVFCDYGFHAIPSAMMKFRFFDVRGTEHVFGYSGDTLYDPARFQEERFPASCRESLEHFFDDAQTIVHEAGAGLIHTDPEDLIPFLRDEQKVFWLHTNRTNDDGFSKGWILEKGRDIIIA